MGIPTKALGMMETPTYPTEIHMLLLIVGGITLLMKSWKSPVNYGKIIISWETLAGLQYSPTSLILKRSTFRVLVIVILGVSQEETQSMNQYHTMVFATNLLNFMTMVAITILLGILMMVIHLMVPV